MKTKTIRSKIGKTIKLFMIIWSVFYFGQSVAQNNPPVAIPDTAAVMTEDTVAIQVLLNDYDPDGDNIHVRSSYTPEHGHDWKNDSLVFYCSNYFYGQDSLLYRIKDDGSPAMSSERAYIYVNVIENPNLPYAVLKGNNIKAGINSFGYMFGKLDYITGYGPTNFEPSFEAPAGSGIHSIFVSNIWIGGLDNLGADSLHFAGERYKQGGDNYFYGPISDIYDEDYDRKYIRL